MKGLAVLSGGMDSTVALLEARANGVEVVAAVHFQYGSKHNQAEYSRVFEIAEALRVPLKVVNLPFIGELFKSDLLITGGEIPEGHYADDNMKKTVVPFRNGIMLSIAIGLAESMDADCVILGNHKGDHAIYPDCREAFIKAMSQASVMGTYKEVFILTPFGDRTKADIAKRGVVLAAPLARTWSCYKGGYLHCGKCGTCVERIEAFIEAGVTDPTLYEDGTEYARKVLAERTVGGEERVCAGPG